MRKLIATLLLSAMSVPAGAAPQWPGWLAGTWAMEDGAAWADEVWTSPRGGMMLGLTRSGFAGETQSWESARIVRKPDGTLAYVIQPHGGPAVEFLLALAGAESIEFANPAHDYPQRIRFWREGQLLMVETARSDGSDAQRFNYRPVETAPVP